jgi:hypothetical protein
MTSVASWASWSSIRSGGHIGRTMNLEPPPATYSSSRSRTSAGGPKAVQRSSAASSMRPRGTKGIAIARAAAGSGSRQQ